MKDGRPTAEIILADTPDQSVRVAANELRKYIEKMSGARLDIVSAPTGKVPTRVYVGESEQTKKLGFSLRDVKYDGYKIVAKGNDVIVAEVDIDWYSKLKLGPECLTAVEQKWHEFTGHKWRSPMWFYSLDRMTKTPPVLGFHRQNATGTLYRVYGLLEQFGFRWYFSFPPPDQNLGKVIPTLKDLDVKDQVTKREPCDSALSKALIPWGSLRTYRKNLEWRLSRKRLTA